MINSVRSTVLSLTNKNNFGYITPKDFNLYAKQAQLDLFLDYFFQYNYQISKENVRQSGTDAANISQQIKEVIDIFTTPFVELNHDTDNKFDEPSEITTGSNPYMILKVACFDTTPTPKKLIAEADKISVTQEVSIRLSNLQQPSSQFPVYVLRDKKVILYPDTYNAQGQIECSYIRFPKDPKWTFTTLVNGTAVFDPTQSDFQDFELRLDDEVSLVTKICQYAGLQIREQEVVQFMKSDEAMNQQTKQ